MSRHWRFHHSISPAPSPVWGGWISGSTRVDRLGRGSSPSMFDGAIADRDTLSRTATQPLPSPCTEDPKGNHPSPALTLAVR